VGTRTADLVALDPEDGVREAVAGVPVQLPALDLPPVRWSGWPTLAALAAGCGVVAILLGAWALVASVRSDDTASPDGTLARSVAVLTDGEAERLPLRGSVGRIVLVVAPDGSAVLALDGLGRAPAGRTYAAWLVPPDSATPGRVAAFTATGRAVPLDRPVARGARVGVTLEAVPPPDRPSRTLRLVAVRR
jgi:hypothetical protein